MIGIDTNILLRIILNDSEQESQRARLILEECLQSTGVFLSIGVILETAWTLKVKKMPRQRIYEILAHFVAIPKVKTDQPKLIQQTLQAFKKGKADFGDYLIWAENQKHGVKVIHTFDKKFAKELNGMLAL